MKRVIKFTNEFDLENMEIHDVTNIALLSYRNIETVTDIEKCLGRGIVHGWEAYSPLIYMGKNGTMYAKFWDGCVIVVEKEHLRAIK